MNTNEIGLNLNYNSLNYNLTIDKEISQSDMFKAFLDVDNNVESKVENLNIEDLKQNYSSPTQIEAFFETTSKSLEENYKNAQEQNDEKLKVEYFEKAKKLFSLQSDYEDYVQSNLNNYLKRDNISPFHNI